MDFEALLSQFQFDARSGGYVKLNTLGLATKKKAILIQAPSDYATLTRTAMLDKKMK